MKFITISGIDKSGKTTLIKAFMEATLYEHYLVDRDPSTYHFFNWLQARFKHDKQVLDYFKFSKKMSNTIDLAILLYANEDDLRQRFAEHNEPKLVGDLSIKEHQKMLEKFFDDAEYKNVLKLNTSLNSVEECINIIKERVNGISSKNI